MALIFLKGELVISCRVNCPSLNEIVSQSIYSVVSEKQKKSVTVVILFLKMPKFNRNYLCVVIISSFHSSTFYHEYVFFLESEKNEFFFLEKAQSPPVIKYFLLNKVT